MGSIPTLDVSLFHSESTADRKQYASALVNSLTKHGFVKLINHGIPEETVMEMFEWSQKFFKIPQVEKDRIAHLAGPTPQRGWSRIGAEKTSTLYGSLAGVNVSLDLLDAREHFDQGAPSDTKFPNKWPSTDTFEAGFQPFMENLFKACEGVSEDILRALELAYALPTGTFVDKCSPNASELRLNHYPPIDIRDLRKGEVNRIWPHFDLGVITLLFQDSIGGLEIGDREHPSEFIPVIRESPYELVLNISETLQRWTNDVLPAGLHQVTMPTTMKHLQEGYVPDRYSVAYFCKAARTTSVGPLQPFVAAGSVPNYDDVTALEYHQRRLQSAYRPG